MKRKLFIILAVYFSVFSAFPGGFFPIAQGQSFNAEKVKDEIIVKFKTIEKIEIIKIAEEDDFNRILTEYNNNPEVEYAEPNYIYRAAIVPSDSYYKNQWYLKKINAEDAWNIIRESPQVIIAIIDSGVQIKHPDLKDNIWSNTKEVANNKIDDDKNGFIDDINGWDFIENTPDPSPKLNNGFTEAGLFHGTIVAGVAAASGNNASGVAGVTWKAQIMALRILDGAGQGNTSNVIKAIDYAIANGAHIINLSFVGLGYSKSMESAIRRAYEAGIVIVAAAGNDEGGEGYSLDKLPMYPVCYDGARGENMVIGVAATDTIDQRAPFSFYSHKYVDISAPGITIFNTIVYSPENNIGGNPLDRHYDGYWSGTSMAAPMVSGAFALVIQANPKLSRQEVIDVVLKNTANINKLNPNYIDQLGAGRLDVLMAVENSKERLTAVGTKLLIAPHSNYKSIIKITDQDGRLSDEFFAYGDKFRGGVNVAAGDIDGDGLSEIITGTGAGGGPHVRIFDNHGNLKGQFFAYGDKFRGGVNVAAGDVNRDGKDEIITAPGLGGGPHIKIFKYSGSLIGQFFAFNEKFKGGVKIAVADIDEGLRESRAEIIVAPAQEGGPQVRIFDSAGNILKQFLAYGQNFHGGVNIAVGDVNNDGSTEIITGAGKSGSPHVRVFKPSGELLSSFFAYLEEFSGGVNLGVLKYK